MVAHGVFLNNNNNNYPLVYSFNDPEKKSLLKMWEKEKMILTSIFSFSHMAWKEYFLEYWLKELQESMDICTGHCDIAEILLKRASNTI